MKYSECGEKSLIKKENELITIDELLTKGCIRPSIEIPRVIGDDIFI